MPVSGGGNGADANRTNTGGVGGGSGPTEARGTKDIVSYELYVSGGRGGSGSEGDEAFS